MAARRTVNAGLLCRTETKMSEDRRQKMLREMLTRLRDETFERVSDFRRDQRDAVTQQGDEMDVARSSSDAETKANLIERAEERLRYIDQALGRARTRQLWHLRRMWRVDSHRAPDGGPLRHLLRRLPAEASSATLSWRGSHDAG